MGRNVTAGGVLRASGDGAGGQGGGAESVAPDRSSSSRRSLQESSSRARFSTDSAVASLLVRCAAAYAADPACRRCGLWPTPHSARSRLRNLATTFVSGLDAGAVAAQPLRVANGDLARGPRHDPQGPGRARLTSFPPRRWPQDQLAELYGLVEALGADIGTFTYDGDTPQDARKAIRARAHIVVTNPDMLHTGILPHHTKWVEAVREPALRRHRRAAHLSRRVRLATWPTCCGGCGASARSTARSRSSSARSATIANPRELAEALTGREMTLVDQNGAPARREVLRRSTTRRW